jgi:hypothetical protein
MTRRLEGAEGGGTWTVPLGAVVLECTTGPDDAWGAP